MRNKAIVVMLGVALLVLGLCACSNSAASSDAGSTADSAAGSDSASAETIVEGVNETIGLMISDVIADVADGSDGKLKLEMNYKVTNISRSRTAKMKDLPQLMLNGKPVEVTYTYQDSKKNELAPGEEANGRVELEYDAKDDNEWGFEAAEYTFVSGLEQYVRIIEAQRNHDGLPPITEADVAKMKGKQKADFEEFLEEEAEKEDASKEGQGK